MRPSAIGVWFDKLIGLPGDPVAESGVIPTRARE